VKEHEIRLGGPSARGLRYVDDGVNVHAPESHDPPLMPVAQTACRTGALVPALCVLAQALDVVVRAEVRDQDRRTRSRVVLVGLISISECLAFTMISFPQSAERHAGPVVTDERT
jgi:hypothetical protein